jgi:5-methyltetrahydropteroyltriglutamate--homocysteine methyltransferase
LRPAALRQAFKQHGAGEIGEADYARVQDQCIRDVVQMQEQIGLEVVTDGEFRRASYWNRFATRVEGLGLRAAGIKFRDESGHESTFEAPYPTGKVRRRQPLAVDEFIFLRGVTKVTPKITLPAPSTMHFYGSGDYGPPPGYADTADFFADLGRIYAEEIAELAKAGCRYVQLDEVAIALLGDPAIRANVARARGNPDRLVDLYIASINQAVAGRARDVTIGVHVCRGNYKGHYLGEGGYDSIAERFFTRTDADVFLLEYDTPRAGGFAPLKLVPKGKGVVLGLVSSKTPALEDIDTLKRRTDEASRYIDLDRLALSPQCGFASSVAGNPLSQADERAKLARVVEASRAIWG